MPALSGGNATLWRTFPQYMEMRAFIDVPPTVYKRRVNQASFDYPMESVSYDNPDGHGGSSTAVTAGLTLRVYNSAGTTLKGIARCRFASAGTITFAPVGQGVIDFADNDILDVVDERRLWVEVPLIQPDGTILKDWGQGFVAADAQPPVALAGPDIAGDVNSGTGLLTVSFVGTNSYAVANGATITGYLWDVEDGTITVGTSTSSSITATFPAGRRYISLTVTDSNGDTHTAYRLIAAIDGSTLSSWKVNNIRMGGRLESGWEASFAIQDATTSTIPFGAKVILYSREKYGSTTQGLNGYSGAENVKFVGWAVRRTVKIKPLTGVDFVVNAQNTLAFMAFSQVTTRASSPVNWFQVANLSWWRHVHYLLHWHSNWLDVCDFERPSYHASYPAMRIDAESGTLDAQLEFLTRSVKARFTCDYQGRCYFRYDIHLMTTAEFAATTSIVSLTSSDWTAEGIDLDYEEQESTGIVWIGGIIASATEIVAVDGAAPGVLPSGIGANEDNLTNQLGADRDDLLYRGQRRYEYLNRKVKRIKIPMKSHGMVADPAWQEPVALTSPTNGAGVSYSAEKMVLTQVDVTFNERDGFGSEVWILEPTSQVRTAKGIYLNKPGETPPTDVEYVPDDGTWEDQIPYDWNDVAPVEYVPDVVNEPPASTESVEAVIFGALSGSKLHYTADWTAGGGSPTWTQRLASVDILLQILAVRGSRIAVYALEADALYYTANITTTDLTSATAISATAILMRQAAGGHIVIASVSGGNIQTQRWNGSLDSAVTVAADADEAAMDVDDFGLGLIVIAANNQLYFKTTYSGGSYTQMSGLTGVTGSADITMIRVPYRRVSGALNNNLAAMEVYYSVYRTGLYRVTYNFLTNSAVSNSGNISPLIGGNPSGVFAYPDTAVGVQSRGEAFETYAGDTRRAMGVFRNGSNAGFYITQNADAATPTWTLKEGAGSAPHAVHFIEPERGGDGLKGWIALGGDIKYTNDFWTTTQTIADAGYTNPQYPRGVIQL